MVTEAVDDEEAEGPWDHWPTVTPSALALLYLADADSQIAEAPTDPIRLAQAAKSVHHALQAALTAALAGGMGIGAYTDKVEKKWLAFLQEGAGQPASDRVMSLGALLAKATSQKPEWTQRPLTLTAQDSLALVKLDKIRDRIEHPRPGVWVIEPEYLFALLAPAARMVWQCVEAVQHQLELEELDRFKRLVASIEARCAT